MLELLTLLLICIEIQGNSQWVSRTLFMRTEWQVHVWCPFDKWHTLEFPLPNIVWTEFEQIPVKSYTGFSVDYDPKIIVGCYFFKMKVSRILSVTHEWPIPAGICHHIFTDWRFFRNIKTPVFISPFSFKCPMWQVSCFPSLTVGYMSCFLGRGDVVIFVFHKTSLTKKCIYYHMTLVWPTWGNDNYSFPIPYWKESNHFPDFNQLELVLPWHIQ